MGISTDAYLFYGVCLPDDFYPELKIWEDEDEVVDLYNWEEVVKKTDLPESNQISMGLHCHMDDPMWFVCAEQYSAWRGSPEEIKSFAVKPKWDLQIKEFCEKLGLPYEQPKWWLVSYWG